MGMPAAQMPVPVISTTTDYARMLPPQVRLMHEMLQEAPWRYFPLTLQFLSPVYAAATKGGWGGGDGGEGRKATTEGS